MKDDAERAARTAAVAGIEASVKTMAVKDATDKLLVGPILSVKSSPIASGSTNDLTQLTSVFEYSAANEVNGDGPQSGHTFNANVNWSDDSSTYGLGKANGLYLTPFRLRANGFAQQPESVSTVGGFDDRDLTD